MAFDSKYYSYLNFCLPVLIEFLVRHELHLTMPGIAVDKAKFELFLVLY